MTPGIFYLESKMLKANDVIVFKPTSKKYRIVFSNTTNTAYIEDRGFLDCGFTANNGEDIQKEEFGVVYSIDLWAHEDGSPLFEEETYGIGDRFAISDGSYILAQVDPKKCLLLNLESGNYWSYAVDVDNTSAITESEMFMITRGEAYTKV